MLQLAVALLVSPLALAPQAAEVPTPAPEQEPASGGEALATLRAAVAAQLTEPFPGRVRGFAVDLNLRERVQGKREVDLALYYREDDGGMVRLVLDDPDRGTRIQKGFDGERYWLRESERPVQELSGKDFVNDTRAIDELFSTSERLLLLLDLGRLESLLRGELAMDRGTSMIRLAGRIALGGAERPFVLELDPITLLPSALHLELPRTGDEPEDAPPRVQVFRMAAYEDGDGRIYPRKIAEYRPSPDRDPAFWVRLLEIHDLVWRVPPSKESFRPR